jgi:hypothetical protein
MAEDILRFSQYESKAIVPLATRAVGVYEQKIAIAGNSLLSSVFVEFSDPGAAVLVQYYDSSTGSDAGEEYFLNAHDSMSNPISTTRILVSNLHDKPFVRCTVTGGNIRFGVYATVVVSSASDIDNALQRENDPVSLTLDKGMPVMVYDETNGVWRFARGEDGIQDVRVVGNISIGEPGDPLFVDASADTVPGSEQTLLSYTVPSLRTINILSVQVVCRQESSFQIYGDGILIGSGRTGAAAPNVNFGYRVARSFAAGKLIQVKATARSGSAAAPIECYLQATLN